MLLGIKIALKVINIGNNKLYSIKNIKIIFYWNLKIIRYIYMIQLSELKKHLLKSKKKPSLGLWRQEEGRQNL